MTTTATETDGTEAPVPNEPSRRHGPAVEIVVPVHNEQAALESSVERLHAYVTAQFPFTFRITIADNASIDGTWPRACALAARLPGVRAVHLGDKGRGRALRTVWGGSDATVLVYMDVDLSTDLAALLPLVAPLLSGHSDVAIGTRLSPGSRVIRGAKREIISRCYNLLLRGALATGFSDAQCGFKAIRRDVAAELLPLVEDTGWFFDTELLVLAERIGLRIHEVPVDWVDDPDSRVDVVATAIADLKGMLRIGRALGTGALPIGRLRQQLGRSPALPGVPAGLAGQLARFAGVGAASTVAYLGLYLLLRGSLGAFAANLVALLVTAVANTAANRRLTFGLGGRLHLRRDHVEGLAVFGLGLALTSGALTALHAANAEPSRQLELAVLVTANLAATLLRFLLFRAWVFHPGRRSAAAARPVSPALAAPRAPALAGAPAAPSVAAPPGLPVAATAAATAPAPAPAPFASLETPL